MRPRCPAGLVLKTEDLKQAVTHWQGMVYGCLAILAVTPCLGFALRELPLTPPEFATGGAGGGGAGLAGTAGLEGTAGRDAQRCHAQPDSWGAGCRRCPAAFPRHARPTCGAPPSPCAGLTIFAAVPTTLGVGEALVRASKGNAALALLLLVSTNSLGARRRCQSLLALARRQPAAACRPGPRALPHAPNCWCKQRRWYLLPPPGLGMAHLASILTSTRRPPWHAGIVTMPPWLRLLLSSAQGLASVSVEVLPLFYKLLATVLAPALIGKVGGWLPAALVECGRRGG